MKKLFTAVLSLLTMFSMIISVNAAEAAIHVRTVEVTAGDDFRVYIDFDDIKNVTGYELKISASNISTIDHFTQPTNGSLSYKDGMIIITDKANTFDYNVGYPDELVSSEVTPSSDISSQETPSDITSVEGDFSENERGLQILAPAVSPDTIDYSSINFKVAIKKDAPTTALSFTVESFTYDSYNSSYDEASGMTYFTQENNIKGSAGDSTSINIVATNVISSDPSSDVSSDTSSNASSNVSSDASSDVSSNTSSTSDEESSDTASNFVPVSRVESEIVPEGTISDENRSEVLPSGDSSGINDYKNSKSILAIIIIIALAFAAGLATMFLIGKLRNADSDDTDVDSEDYGKFQPDFISRGAAEDEQGFSEITDEEPNTKAEQPNKAKFDINIEYDESWNDTEIKNDEDKIEPYYFDEN